MIKRLYLIFYTFGKQLQRDNIGAYASSMAFFFLLSVVPILLIGTVILSYLPFTEEMVVSTLEQFTPGFIDDVIENLVSQVYNQSQGILPIAIIVMLWSAGKGMWGMMMGLNTANEVTEDRNIVFVRIRASFYSVLMLIMLIMCFGMIIAGENFVGYIRRLAPKLAEYFGIIGNLRFLVVWGFLTLFFALLYTFLPNKKLKIRFQIPGAAFSAIGWTVISWGYALYLDYYDGFSVYGSLSTPLLIMIWMYVCMYILLIGANLNRYFGSVIKSALSRKEKA
ncbi:MAG: YihY/virulence factor BrkB family protein [Lachnospiraceae bacterium]|nr:YihY/virulence factor BrkB family protein [Lachnospiraceae bacterium]